MSTSKIEKYGKLLGEWKIKKVLYENRNGTVVFQIYKLGTDWEENCALKVVPVIDEYGEWNQLSKEIKESYLEAKMENRKSAEKEIRHMYTMRRCSNIVSYYNYEFADWSEDNRFGCDLLIRMDLLDCLRNCMHVKKYSEKEIIKIGIDICKALVQCHKNDIIHRDIKPENIFVNEFGDYLLGDFGIARIVNNSKRASTSIGTIEYMAPEQVQSNNKENYSFTVDIYSLGLILYELGNGGKLPFAKSIRITQAENALRLSGKRLPAPNGVGEGLATIILKACEYDATNRYQSADEFLQDLVQLDGEIYENRKEKTNLNVASYNEEKIMVSDDYATVPAERGISIGLMSSKKEEENVIIDYEKNREIKPLMREKDDNDRRLSTREMTQEEREQFALFIHSERTRRQIINVLDNTKMESQTNVIITGKYYTTALAKLIFRYVLISSRGFSGKVAKVSGEAMNKKNVSSVLEEVRNGAIIITDAPLMEKETVENLAEELGKYNKKIIVFLLGREWHIDEFINKYDEIASVFPLRIDIKEFDANTLMSYGHKYARERDYEINELGLMALHSRIEKLIDNNSLVTLEDVEEIVEAAMANVKRNLFVRHILKSDKILQECDFNIE